MENLVLFLKALCVILIACSQEVTSSDCEYTCPPGYIKESNGKEADINGCGGQGSIDVNELYPEFTNICNDHDRCYDDCGDTKDNCDKKFKKAMNSY